MKFNVNEHVGIKLTEHGRKFLRANGHRVPQEDAEGWSRWQLWTVMAIFGSELHIGGVRTMFETTIDIPESR